MMLHEFQSHLGWSVSLCGLSSLAKSEWFALFELDMFGWVRVPSSYAEDEEVPQKSDKILDHDS